MAAEPAAPAKPPTIADLMRERVTVAERALKLATTAYEHGMGTTDDVNVWAARLLGAKLELATTRADRLALLTESVAFAKARVRDAEARHKDGSDQAGRCGGRGVRADRRGAATCSAVGGGRGRQEELTAAAG
jgi:hypothetical protein